MNKILEESIKRTIFIAFASAVAAALGTELIEILFDRDDEKEEKEEKEKKNE